MAKAYGELSLFLITAFAYGCASGPAPTSASSQAHPVISAETQQEVRDAESTYRNCLRAAAKFADNGQYSDATLPLVITPMCYPQFAKVEAALTEGQAGDARRALVRDSDQRQIDLAKEAIDQERGRTTVASSR
jgi:hypothetical protein